jgi:preprotein translocase subunit SecD
MPGVDDPERVKYLVKGEARLELKAVVPGTQLFHTGEEALASLGGTLPSDLEILRIHESRGDGSGAINGYYLVEKTPVINGADLRDVRGVPAQQGIGYHVAFNLKPKGEKFEAWTSKNIGNLLAIVLNDEIKSAPSIKSTIRDSGMIEGSFTKQQADDLRLVLRSGGRDIESRRSIRTIRRQRRGRQETPKSRKATFRAHSSRADDGCVRPCDCARAPRSYENYHLPHN